MNPAPVQPQLPSGYSQASCPEGAEAHTSAVSAMASANEAGQLAESVVGQFGAGSGDSRIQPPLWASQYAKVLQSFEGSSPYSQKTAAPRGVQAVPWSGTVAGQASSTAGQLTWLSLWQPAAPAATTSPRTTPRYAPRHVLRQVMSMS